MKTDERHMTSTVNKTTSVILGLIVGLVCAVSQAQPGTILWQYDVGALIYSTPALAADGTVYVATLNSLFAITNSGGVASNKWIFSAQVTGSPTIGADGTIYFLTQPGPLYALNPSGGVKWTFPVARAGGGSVAIGVDGTLYFLSDGTFYSVSSAGTSNWTSFLGSGGYTITPNSPTIARDGTIYIPDGGMGFFCAFAPDGTKKWCVTPQASNGVGESAAVGSDGTTYISGGPLDALNSSGSNIWSTIFYGFAGNPVIGPDGTLYAAVSGITPLWAITPSGQLAWGALNASRSQITTPAVDCGGTVYYCVSNSIWALTPQGNVLWAVTYPPNPFGDAAIASPIIGPDGTIYAALGTTVYAIASGTNGPAHSAWPMYQQNPRHTGKVEGPVLQSPKKRADSNFQFQLYPQQFGLTYTIQSSTDLNTWLSLTSFVANSLPIDFVDLSASNLPACYYRAFSSP